MKTRALGLSGKPKTEGHKKARGFIAVNPQAYNKMCVLTVVNMKIPHPAVRGQDRSGLFPQIFIARWFRHE